MIFIFIIVNITGERRLRSVHGDELFGLELGDFGPKLGLATLLPTFRRTSFHEFGAGTPLRRTNRRILEGVFIAIVITIIDPTTLGSGAVIVIVTHGGNPSYA
jgi:hypothetical protein